jgi:hypothetical protein
MTVTPLLARVHDANVYVLDRPWHDDDPLVVGMLHPFDLDGEGHLARVYRLAPRSVTISPAAEENTEIGFGVEEIDVTPSGTVTLSHDDEVWVRVELSLPCEIAMKSVMLERHPEQEGSKCYDALRALEADEKIAWVTTYVVRCEPYSS